jgi:4,5-dihydroxyphthalate decarboxylase
MTAVPLTLACGAYDRTEALRTGAVRPEGVDLTYLALSPEETFYRMLRHREFDASGAPVRAALAVRRGRAIDSFLV